jgi:hypothetical protein
MDTSRAPIVGAGLWREVVDLAKERCQCTGACGKKHLPRGSKARTGRCDVVDGQYAGPRKGHVHLLALPRNPLLPWHKAASLPARRLIAFCPDCADGVRRAIARAEKAMPPQDGGLFDTESYRAAASGDVT